MIEKLLMHFFRNTSTKKGGSSQQSYSIKAKVMLLKSLFVITKNLISQEQ